LDLDKEAVLQKNYGVTISPAQLAAEIQRIDTSTRAPEMLAEIKAALGNDPEKFANAFAKPLLVERELRRRFENDDALHAAARRECEQVRFALLTARTNGASPTQLLEQLRRDHSNEVSDVTWQLGARPAETNAPAADELEVRQRFGPDAQILSTAAAGPDPKRKFYFADLPVDLQQVLRVQLQRAGDVSAVIETPEGFLLYLARKKTGEALGVAVLSLRKRNYEQWLEEQSGGSKK
jgi:hypothetical protein